MLYLDASHIVRLYVNDPGWERVQALAETDSVACSVHGQAETVAAFHRKFREGIFSTKDFAAALGQFREDCRHGAYEWLPLSLDVVARIAAVYETLPASIALRASHAVHLSAAAENGFKQIYSNDVRLIGASSAFGLKGLNVISA